VVGKTTDGMMSGKRFIGSCAALVTLYACLFGGSAAAVDYRWFFATGTGGNSDAAIKNKEGASFTISCAAAGNRKMTVKLISPLVKAGKTDLQVVVDDDRFQFEINSGYAEIAGRLKEGQLIRLVAALEKTKQSHFTVELPGTQAELSFSTLEAKKWLTGLLDGCLDKPIPPQSTYIGNWYVENPKACKDKPGQSAELVTYTANQIMEPESTCKIVKVTPIGSSTELLLLCNGEGETGVRQKQIVEVVGGKLHVTYIVSGRRMTDTYSRCP
jgi:hypothetical protein